MRAERVELYRKGADAAEALLREVYGVDVSKVLDPLDQGDFLAIVGRLSRALRAVARPAEDNALRRALERLDVDWPNLSPAARDEVIRAARQALRSVEDQVLPVVDQLFEAEADRVVGRARRSVVRRFDLRIGADVTRTDERVARFVHKSQANFVRDEYGRRREDFSRKAKDIVTSGVERGLGRDDIVAELSGAIARDAFDRSRDYWEVVSMVFTNRARTFTQVAAFEEAGIERYRFEAVLDEATCLPAGVRVATGEGDLPVEQVRPGVHVWTHQGRLALVRATQVTRRQRPMCLVRVGDRSLRSTANHPFLVRRAGRLAWVPAAEIVPGDRLIARRAI